MILDDTAAAPGLCVSFFTQGCERHCPGCHNAHTWDPEGGHEFKPDTLQKLITAIGANNIVRDLCIMGGEPLEEYNLFLTRMIIEEVRKVYPTIKIYLWTGYTLKELQERPNTHLKNILMQLDYLIDGPFDINHKDTSLYLRGSPNQQIYKFDHEKFLWYNITEECERKYNNHETR